MRRPRWRGGRRKANNGYLMYTKCIWKASLSIYTMLMICAGLSDEFMRVYEGSKSHKVH